MAQEPAEVTVDIQPERRVDIIDVSKRIEEQAPGFLSEFPRTTYTSYHTTAGYFEQVFAKRLGHDRQTLQAYVGSFQGLFPEGADYRHDQMDLRDELSDEQKLVEPRNADSHLTFIGSGLENTVTYHNEPDTPVYFVDLDGVYEENRRNRRTTALGYNRDEIVDQFTLEIPVSKHPIDSINLWDPQLGLFDRLHELIRIHGIDRGRIDLALDPCEKNTGLTVNEYETLLMRHDLREVLQDPIRFMAQRGRNMLRDPKAIKEKAKDYAKYDLVHFVNRFIDRAGLSESFIERVIDKFVQVPAQRFLRMKRGVSLVVEGSEAEKPSRIIAGTYQSPILVQWRRAETGARRVNVTYTRYV
ncbi:MAG: hypothetical protein JJ896_18080 [Rhodothermales bacterium]|nr:hypothetical protein [Rhodothermales bacterium]MBO6781573.1 hypothetical protein [Rhodothermales bacterium]